jgi:hypothetical protein
MNTALTLSLAVAIGTLGISRPVLADCIYGAKSKTSYIVLDNHTIILKGGGGKDILVKSFAFFYSSS